MQLSTILLWMISLTLVTTGVLARPQPPGLITLPAANDDQPASDASVCCRGPLILSCHPATVDPRVFSSRIDILLPGTDHVFNFMNAVQPNGQHYTSTEGDDATLTLNPQTGSMFGTMKCGDRAFSLEHCEDGYVWVEYDIQAIQEEEEGDMGENEVDAAQINDSSASQDTTTLEEFSVMIYYTPQFAAITPDIPGFVDQVLAETNQGYINSKVPMSIKLHCIEEATVNDISSSSATVNNFVAMKGSTAALRHSADTTVLLVASMGPSACGRAYGINKISSGETISACAKSCALGYFSFGHELAHSFGAYHNRETGHINPFYSYGQGHLIAKGTASTGYRSILAYNANGHSRRVNYYSNPSVIFLLTGTPTGTADSNNAAVLTRNRMALKEVGDESETCKGTTPTPPSGVPWTKVFAHDTSGGLFTSGADALLKNPENPAAKLFSILSQLDPLRLEDGSFHFKLCYQELRKCNEWTQTSNPAKSSMIKNFNAIELGFPKNSYGKAFTGIGVSPASSSWTFIDDTPSQRNWFFAIGATTWWGGSDTIPGPHNQKVKRVELYAEKPDTPWTTPSPTPPSGGPWTKVFSHDTSGGLFTSGAEALSKNSENPEAKLFSILSQLDPLRLEDGSFHLKLCYPELSNCNEWTQTSNPATTSTIENFKGIELGFPKNSYGKAFTGLGVSPASSSWTFIDDTPSQRNWFFAIGATTWWGGSGTIPGPHNQKVKRVELYAEKPETPWTTPSPTPPSGGPWTKVFSHDTSGGLFTSGAETLSKNSENPDAKLFSILSQLDPLRLEDGSFHLKLCYPELTNCNEWTQTTNPATSSTIENFKAIELGFPKNSYGKAFTGLGVSPASSSWTFIDDTPSQRNWFFAIGATTWWGGSDTIPGPHNQKVKRVELYAEKPETP